MAEHSLFAQAFIRDIARCVYCGKNLMESFDAFCQSQLDHLKPKVEGGKDNDLDNRVISCFACNNLKGAFDPSPDAALDQTNRDTYIAKAKEYIAGKKDGSIESRLYADYKYWVDRPELLARK